MFIKKTIYHNNLLLNTLANILITDNYFKGMSTNNNFNLQTN